MLMLDLAFVGEVELSVVQERSTSQIVKLNICMVQTIFNLLIIVFFFFTH